MNVVLSLAAWACYLFSFLNTIVFSFSLSSALNFHDDISISYSNDFVAYFYNLEIAFADLSY